MNLPAQPVHLVRGSVDGNSVPFGCPERQSLHGGVGRNLAYRKSLFVEKGFGGDEAYVGGDDDLLVNQHAHRKNTVVEISAESQTCSEFKKTGRAYFIQKTGHLSAGKRYRIKD